MNLNLKKITYVGFLLRDTVDANNSIDKVLKIGHETSKGIDFYNKIVYTAQKPDCETYDFNIEIIESQEWGNYTNWLSTNSIHMFDSEYMINFHADGMIQNKDAWTNEFYNYDYIGAPWDRKHKAYQDRELSNPASARLEKLFNHIYVLSVQWSVLRFL